MLTFNEKREMSSNRIRMNNSLLRRLLPFLPTDAIASFSCSYSCSRSRSAFISRRRAIEVKFFTALTWQDPFPSIDCLCFSFLIGLCSSLWNAMCSRVSRGLVLAIVAFQRAGEQHLLDVVVHLSL
jgi:hypothetical protein